MPDALRLANITPAMLCEAYEIDEVVFNSSQGDSLVARIRHCLL